VRARLRGVCGIRLGQGVGALRPVFKVMAGAIDIVVVVEGAGGVKERATDFLLLVPTVIGVLARPLAGVHGGCRGLGALTGACGSP
jgi:hypothetical protein